VSNREIVHVPGSTAVCPHKALDARNKFTPEVAEEICKLIRRGNYRETAAAASGVTGRTLRRWLYAAANGDERYALFAADLEVAEAEAESRDVAMVGIAAGKDWRAAAWRLERKYPHKYGQQIKVAVASELEKFFRILEEVLDNESLQRVYTALAATDAGSEAAEFVEFDVEAVEESVAGSSAT